MRKVVLLCLLLSVSLILFSQYETIPLPYPIVVGLQDSDGSILSLENLYWEAWSSTHPSDVLNPVTSLNSGYFPDTGEPVGYLQVQGSDFNHSLADGEVLTIYLMNINTGADARLEIEVNLLNGSEIYSDTVMLSTLKAPPPLVKVKQPLDDSVINGEVVLQWHPAQRAEGYRVYLGVNEDVMKLIGEVNQDIYSFKPNVKQGSSYFWRVEAFNEFGDSVLADIHRFKVE
ncbi:MAG: hypothetical protein JXR56_02715 [Candidatus Cloacimonetes bacterium]|nr:hypothetical protein [Candidatus Cloacimonadota bacterium]